MATSDDSSGATFDEYNPQYQLHEEWNKIFLQSNENWAGEVLKARGHIFLNEVFDQIGFPRTKAGQVQGWWLEAGNHNEVDFDISPFTADNGKVRYHLSFNIDGDILGRLP